MCDAPPGAELAWPFRFLGLEAISVSCVCSLTVAMLVLWCVFLIAFAGMCRGQNEGEKFSEMSTYERCVCPNGPCACVVYYLCGLDGIILTTGSTIVDERFGEVTPVAACPGVQICCKKPAENETRPLISVPTEPPPKKAPCGQRGIAFDLDQTFSRINSDNGTTAFAEYPWMLIVLRADPSGVSTFVCGASLINARVALTAAHCVQKYGAQDLVVRAGEWNTTSINEPLPHQDRFVSSIVLHPEFIRGPLFNDMALLILSEPLQETLNVEIVCLPSTDAVFDSRRCVATGWGQDIYGKTGKMHTTLRKVDLPIVDSASCQERLRKTRLGIFFRLDSSFICAGGEPDKDTCQGDGGGPLMCPTKDNPEVFVQVGIVSWGIGCKDSQNPAVYTNVAFLRNWIDQQLTLLGVDLLPSFT